MLMIIIVFLLLHYIKKSEIYNAVAAFLVIDISNTERKNLKKRIKVYFYDSLSIISRAIVCGFTAPLLFTLFFGNSTGIMYALIYNIALDDDYEFFKIIFNVLIIVPAIIVQIFIYIIYLCRNKKIFIDFKGDYIINCFIHPLLNVDIMAAYIESVNFYFYYNGKDMEYLKSYGDYKNKIDDVCIKDYLSITYGICTVIFIIFLVLLNLYN